ncbi:MAG: hypothetical protein IJY24_02985 [Clostridia bacterium]|nr:hypothetical protein [Clostridia bacterium]
MLHNIMKNHRTAVIFCAIVAFALLVGLIGFSVVSAHIQEQRRIQCELETEALLIERSELNDQYTHMEHTVRGEIGIVPNSNITLVFLGIEREIYTEVFPSVNEITSLVSGTVCLGKDNMPGEEGCLSLSELQELTEAGWSYAILFEGNGAEQLSDFISSMRISLAELGLEMPDTVICRAGSYSPSLDDTLIDEGIKHVVHNAEEQTARIDKTVDGELFHPGAVGWRAEEMQRYFMAELMQYGGCACFTLELDALGADIRLDMNNEALAASFGRMIEAIGGWAEDGLVTARDVAFGLENRRLYLGTYEQVEEVVSERRREIQTRLDEIERELEEIYKRYR